jgi:hypothetical protein
VTLRPDSAVTLRPTAGIGNTSNIGILWLRNFRACLELSHSAQRTVVNMVFEVKAAALEISLAAPASWHRLLINPNKWKHQMRSLRCSRGALVESAVTQQSENAAGLEGISMPQLVGESRFCPAMTLPIEQGRENLSKCCHNPRASSTRGRVPPGQRTGGVGPTIGVPTMTFAPVPEVRALIVSPEMTACIGSLIVPTMVLMYSRNFVASTEVALER